MKLPVTAAASGRPNASGKPASKVTSTSTPGGPLPSHAAGATYSNMRSPGSATSVKPQRRAAAVTCTNGISARGPAGDVDARREASTGAGSSVGTVALLVGKRDDRQRLGGHDDLGRAVHRLAVALVSPFGSSENVIVVADGKPTSCGRTNT